MVTDILLGVFIQQRLANATKQGLAVLLALSVSPTRTDTSTRAAGKHLPARHWVTVAPQGDHADA